MKLWLSILVAVLCFAGCSNRQVYESIRANREQQCRALQGDARAQCLAPYDKSYDAYQRGRDADQAGAKD